LSAEEERTFYWKDTPIRLYADTPIRFPRGFSQIVLKNPAVLQKMLRIRPQKELRNSTANEERR
jgi:hypothetical protein